MSDEDAAIRAAKDAAYPGMARTHAIYKTTWAVSDNERIAYRAGIVAGMRRAAEIAPEIYANGLRAMIRAAADQLEQEQSR